jgi:hypothetical protein
MRGAPAPPGKQYGASNGGRRGAGTLDEGRECPLSPDEPHHAGRYNQSRMLRVRRRARGRGAGTRAHASASLAPAANASDDTEWGAERAEGDRDADEHSETTDESACDDAPVRTR